MNPQIYINQVISILDSLEGSRNAFTL